VGQVAITVNGRSYQIACEDGQEAHLSELGAYIDKRVSDLVASVGQIGDMRLLLMASLLIADELSEVYDELDVARARASKRAGKTAGKTASPSPAQERPEGENETLASGLEAMARRIEDIATRLERA
jgi:cell division protein ZapA